MKAWHFISSDRRLRYDDNRRVEAGEIYTTDADPVLCIAGMHGSIKPLDALSYAPGPIVCRVDITGDVVQGDDKIVGRSREVLWMADATDVLWKFARLCALDVAHLWDPPNIVLRYLRTGDESIRAAAWDAAWTAACGAARAAAGTAAGTAAWTAARDAAWDAAWDAQNRRLYRMLMELRATGGEVK